MTSISAIAIEAKPSENGHALLDLFSISQTSELASATYAHSETETLCTNGAPFIALQTAGKAYRVVQGCCNDWTCPRCGQIRAKREYGRMVMGCRELAQDHELYFITLTCRGRELSLEDSQANYLEWTNRLLTALRTRAKRDGKPWHYVQVTERQQRGHPHSHMMTTFYPHDLREGNRKSWKHSGGLLVSENVPASRSDWLQERCISAGLGDQYDISKVRDAEAASRYVAKYLFKPTIFQTHWPKKWRRIRYSRSFPKLPETEIEAFPLIKKSDWRRLARLAVVVTPDSPVSHNRCLEMLHGSDVIIRSLPQTRSEVNHAS